MTTDDQPETPPGQRVRADFPRFGLPQFANRFPDHPNTLSIRIHGEVAKPFVVGAEISALSRVKQISDFHCVTTWTHQGLCWEGYRFSEVFRELIAKELKAPELMHYVIFRCQDGYRVSFLLQDLLADDVMLADTLNDERLKIAHGAPVRLVAPAHYGYKNPKHISGIELVNDLSNYRSASFRFMEHPRARVEYEERGRFFPGWLLRILYRPLVKGTAVKFRKALAQRLQR